MQTKAGAQKAKENQIKKLMGLYKVDHEKGEQLYKARLSVIAYKGGKVSSTGGYASKTPCDGKCGLSYILGENHTVPQCSGFKGGMKSRRGK